jgi:hypothetical protein
VFATVEGADAGPVPRRFVAVTVQRYCLAGVSPLTVTGDDVPVTDFVAPPLVDVHVAVNPEIRLPLPEPGVKETRSAPAATRFTVTAVGAAGTPMTMSGDGFELRLGPRPLLATTVQRYVFPVASPPTTIEVPFPSDVLVMPPSVDAHVAL